MRSAAYVNFQTFLSPLLGKTKDPIKMGFPLANNVSGDGLLQKMLSVKRAFLHGYNLHVPDVNW